MFYPTRKLINAIKEGRGANCWVCCFRELEYLEGFYVKAHHMEVSGRPTIIKVMLS